MSKDYAAIAAKKIRKPGAIPPRVLIYARNKKGKTRFAATAGKVLIIDPEGGADWLPEDGSADIWPVESWTDIDEVYNYLKTSEAQSAYDWVSVDGLTRINNMALKFVMKQEEERNLDRQPGMVAQRDYGKAGELMKGLLYNFHSLPYGIIYSAQERQENPGVVFDEDEDTEDVEVRYVPDLPKGVRNAVNGIVDVIGRIYTVRVEHPKTGDMVTVRRLWLSPIEQLDTGYRSNYRLPDFIKNPTVEKLTKAIQEGANS